MKVDNLVEVEGSESMSLTEDYFFSNNISIWSHRRVRSLTWFNTDDGQFIQNGLGQLYREDEGKCERVV